MCPACCRVGPPSWGYANAVCGPFGVPITSQFYLVTSALTLVKTVDGIVKELRLPGSSAGGLISQPAQDAGLTS